MFLFKNPIIAVAMIALSAIVFYLANAKGLFGKVANWFFPCQQDPTTSFPCYMGVDITVMIISVVVGMIFVVALIISLMQR